MPIGHWSHTELGNTYSFSGDDPDTGRWAVTGKLLSIIHHRAPGGGQQRPGELGGPTTVLKLQVPYFLADEISLVLPSNAEPDNV